MTDPYTRKKNKVNQEGKKIPEVCFLRYNFQHLKHFRCRGSRDYQGKRNLSSLVVHTLYQAQPHVRPCKLFHTSFALF